MARAQSQWLRIFDDGGTYQRWQSYYINSIVSFAGGSWIFQRFDVEGFDAGQTGDEGGVTVSVPATALIMDIIADALRNARLVELSMYEFDTLDGDEEPQEGQVLIASYVGEVVAADGVLETMNIELGSSLSPVGAQIPPRKFTSRLVGVPCKL
jgi:4-amino-4-deoxy-L-arabinose transferase-like glycosyltransferase